MKFIVIISTFVSILTLTPTHATQTVTYYHSNALGSPVAATDEAGNVLWREAYEPYGLRLIKDANSSGNNRYFTGHPEDSSTGLTYMGSRFYDPRVGRFLSPDPQRFKETNLASFNRYAYGNHNPYKFVDPDGEFAIPYGVATGLLVVGGGIILSKSPMWQQIINSESNEESNNANDSASNAPPVPDVLVGDQSDPRAGQRGRSKRHTSGGLLPEHGGVNDGQKDFDHLTGGDSRPDSGRGEGVRIGSNGISIRPGKAGEGPRIDIPANGDKPHETLHY